MVVHFIIVVILLRHIDSVPPCSRQNTKSKFTLSTMRVWSFISSSSLYILRGVFSRNGFLPLVSFLSLSLTLALARSLVVASKRTYFVVSTVLHSVAYGCVPTKKQLRPCFLSFFFVTILVGRTTTQQQQKWIGRVEIVNTNEYSSIFKGFRLFFKLL